MIFLFAAQKLRSRLNLEFWPNLKQCFSAMGKIIQIQITKKLLLV